jgi:hypothetical protein
MCIRGGKPVSRPTPADRVCRLGAPERERYEVQHGHRAVACAVGYEAALATAAAVLRDPPSAPERRPCDCAWCLKEEARS